MAVVIYLIVVIYFSARHCWESVPYIHVFDSAAQSQPAGRPAWLGISHYLLYREASVNKIWKSISLYGRVDHRVFGLGPDTMYDFVIMACDKNSECQVSNMVTLKTERSAY